MKSSATQIVQCSANAAWEQAIAHRAYVFERRARRNASNRIVVANPFAAAAGESISRPHGERNAAKATQRP